MRHAPLALLALLVIAPACKKPERYQATVEVLKVRRFGQDPRASITELELKWSDCPGDALKVVRADKSFAECGAKIQRGDKLAADVVLTYSSERGSYRNEIVRLGDCPLKVDPKDEANFELVQTCRPLLATGVDVGVHCERSRSPELVAKCPWLRRR